MPTILSCTGSSICAWSNFDPTAWAARICEFILGSTTTATVRTCLVPVLMFR